MAGILTSGFYSLFSKFNKTKGKGDDDKQEGLIESLGEITLDTDDAELLTLSKAWDLQYDGSVTKKRIHEEGDTNLRYWTGKQFPDSEYDNNRRPLTDNVVFEAVETMIPQATQQNPEPVVLTDNGEVTPAMPPQPPTPQNPQGSQGVPAVTMQEIGEKVHMALEYLANVNNLKTRLKKGVRHWAMRFVGCWQIGWNDEENEISLHALNPKDLILDPNGYIEDGEYHGEYLGVKKYDTAQNLIARFPHQTEGITKECQGKLGSLMGYVQWWTDEMVFYRLKSLVLFKSKNPHWNYDKTSTTIDPNGQPIPQTVPGNNHFSRPKIPFVFLTVFDLGDEPCDKSGLVQQGLVTQDNINKRLKQIDRNNDNINGGIVVNGLMFNKEQSGQVAEARRSGRTIVTPGKPADAIFFPPNQPLPDSLYESLKDQRERFMARFGISGSTAESTKQETTVRGKIIVGQQDTSRTGGGVTEYLELAAAKIFDQFLQFIYVYWNTPHWISVIGPDNAMQVATLQASDIPSGRKIFVTVQNGSMVPQDELSIYNEAMSLWEGGALDPLSLFEKLKDSNPQDRAQKLMLYKMNPQLYSQQYLQVAPPIATPLPEGGGGSESGAPPASVTPPTTEPNAEQVESKQIIQSVPIPK